MNIFESTRIVLETEDRNYHNELQCFDNFQDAQDFFLYNLSEYKFLSLRYFNGNEYVEGEIINLYKI